LAAAPERDAVVVIDSAPCRTGSFERLTSAQEVHTAIRDMWLPARR